MTAEEIHQASMEGRINLMPNFDDVRTWSALSHQMVESHRRKSSQMANVILKRHEYADFFKSLKHLAGEEVNFWTAMSQIATRELSALTQSRLEV